MSSESKIIFNLIEKVYSLVEDQENWFEHLPKSFSEEFTHTTYGKTTFTFTLSSSNESTGGVRYYLNFRITIGNSYTERWIAFGDRAKVVNEIMIYSVDQSKIEKLLPDMYMGMMDYPR